LLDVSVSKQGRTVVLKFIRKSAVIESTKLKTRFGNTSFGDAIASYLPKPANELSNGYVFYDPVYAMIETNYGEILAAVELSPNPSIATLASHNPNLQKSHLWNLDHTFLSGCAGAREKIELLTAIAGFMAALKLHGVKTTPNSLLSWADGDLGIGLFNGHENVKDTGASQQDLWVYVPQQKDFLFKLSGLDELEVHLALANCNLRGLGVPQELRQA
jgi:hypothetical protein